MEIDLNIEDYELYEKYPLELVGVVILQKITDIFKYRTVWKFVAHEEKMDNLRSKNFGMDVEPISKIPDKTKYNKYMLDITDYEIDSQRETYYLTIPYFFVNPNEKLISQLQNYIKNIEKIYNETLKEVQFVLRINLITGMKNPIDFDYECVYDSSDESTVKYYEKRTSSRKLSLKMSSIRHELEKRLPTLSRNGSPKEISCKMNDKNWKLFRKNIDVENLCCIDITDTYISSGLQQYYEDDEDLVVGKMKIDNQQFEFDYTERSYSNRDYISYFISNEKSSNYVIAWNDSNMYLIYNPSDKIHTLKLEDDEASAFHCEIMFVDLGETIECYERLDNYNAASECDVTLIELDKYKMTFD